VVVAERRIRQQHHSQQDPVVPAVVEPMRLVQVVQEQQDRGSQEGPTTLAPVPEAAVLEALVAILQVYLLQAQEALVLTFY